MDVKKNGFTLLEILLALGIMGGILVMAINYGTRRAAQARISKTALEMQQILEAGLNYYGTVGVWPVSCNFTTGGTNQNAFSSLSSLETNGFLPANFSNNPYGNAFTINCNNTNGVFYVLIQLPSTVDASVVAGYLPLAYVSDNLGNVSSSGVYVTAQVLSPIQSSNSTGAVNFAGIYHHGACVPVPSCPNYDTTANPPGCVGGGTNCMTPEIIASPVSVSGLNDQGSSNTYPITSFTAYAYGPSSSPQDCYTGAATSCALGSGGSPSPNGLYWRACLKVITQKGDVAASNSNWGQFVSLMAITRCVPPQESSGSDFSVYTQ